MTSQSKAAEFLTVMESVARYMSAKMYQIAMQGSPPRPPSVANPFLHMEFDWACEVMSAALNHRRKFQSQVFYRFLHEYHRYRQLGRYPLR